MSLSFRIRRRAGIPPPVAPLPGSSEVDECYRNWRDAGNALHAAERANGPVDAILRLSAQVIRAPEAR